MAGGVVAGGVGAGGRGDVTPAPVDSRPHVVIVGGGFGGLAAAQAMGGSGVRVTLVDRHNYHLFVPLLYQVATAVLSPGDIAAPIRGILSRYPNVDVVMAEVTGVDPASRQVRLDGLGFVPYDRLVLATGSTQSYFGHDEWAAHAPALKTMEDARRIRARLLAAFERAELASDEAERCRLMTVVVIGGGPTGVEMAGTIAGLVRQTLVRDFRRIRPETARVVLVEAGPRILGSFPEELSDYALNALRELGVEVRVGEPVEDIGPGRVRLSGGTIAAETIVWGAGVRAAPAASWLGARTDRGGRIVVASDLSVPGLEGVYALGDVAFAAGEDGTPLPGLAQVAKQQGQHLGRALAANLTRGTPLPPFVFRNRGNLAVVGRNHAVADFGRRRLKGRRAWLFWCVVHVYLLVGFRNRLLVTAQWLWSWATYGRGARLILEDGGAPRAAIAEEAIAEEAARSRPRIADAG
ncbi:MAG TPA: NAD(P)/FAD-dependent oxidoreductase [Azospirillaceae bacterium]|nr:NAD(P)/FAD-dependent oxidoreductase [Azospirillaceae bacterium]